MEVLSFEAETDWLYDWEAVLQPEVPACDWTDWDWDSESVPAVSKQSESKREESCFSQDSNAEGLKYCSVPLCR